LQVWKQIWVKLPSGRTINVSSSRTRTISQVKLDIQQQIGISVEDQVLTLGPKELDNRSTLAECGVYSWYHENLWTLRLQFRIPPHAAESTFSIDPSRLWIPSSIEQEVKYRETERRKLQPMVETSYNQRVTQSPDVFPVREPDIIAYPDLDTSQRESGLYPENHSNTTC